MKRCKKCGEEKELSEFQKDPSYKFGLKSACKRCCSKARVLMASFATERRREINKRYYEANQDKCYKASLSWAKSNPDKKAASSIRAERKRRNLQELPNSLIEVLAVSRLINRELKGVSK